jgi:WD40 repeat protein
VAKVFVSHASEDLELAFGVHRWLVEHGHEAFLDQDLRNGIAVGEQWKQQLHERLRWANAVVCVVTSAYLASQWCTAEVSIALSRGNRLLPVRAEPGVTHALLTSIQHTDLAPDRAAALAALAEALRRVDDAGDSEWLDDRSPFPGLRPFDTDRHRVFFGRAREIDQLAERLRSMAEHTESAALLVVGPSGCGKSSLVRAGLLPVIAGEPGCWTLPPMMPGGDPLAALARGLAAAAEQIGLGWTSDHVHAQLDEGSFRKLATELLLATPGGAQRLVVVVDQFEELFTQTTSAERTQFTKLLGSALDGPVQVVATLRSESLDHFLGDPELSNLRRYVYTLGQLRHEMLRAVIKEPAELAGIAVDERLVTRLIEDTNSGEALPLLAFTLAQLADGISRGGQLSNARYEQLGGVRGALAGEADAALAEAVANGGRSDVQVIAGLLRLVAIDERGRPTRWRVDRAELPVVVATELDAFVARRLLITDTENGQVVMGVAHEAFLSAWPPLAEVIAANASALRARRAVEQAATEWVGNGRSRERLWGGGQLAAIVADIGARIGPGSAPSAHRGSSLWLLGRQRVLVADRVDLSPRASDFLYASIRYDRYRRARGVTILSVLLVLALVGAGVAVVQQRKAEDRQRIATAGQLVAQADNIRKTDPRAALQLGIAAIHLNANPTTEASLVETLTTSHYASTLNGFGGQVTAVALSPDGHTLAAGASNGSLRIWDVSQSHRPVQLGAPITDFHSVVTALAWRPDGKLLLAGDNRELSFWGMSDPNHPKPLAKVPGFGAAVSGIAWAADNFTFVVGNAYNAYVMEMLPEGIIRVTAKIRLDARPDAPSLVLSRDGRTLVTHSGESTVQLWDTADHEHPRPLGNPLPDSNSPITAIALSSDGQVLATGSEDTTVTFWNIQLRDHPRDLGQSGNIGLWDAETAMVFDRDDHTLLCASRDGTIQQLQMPTGGPLAQQTAVFPRPASIPLTGHHAPITSISLNPKGGLLASGSIDGTVLLWDLTDDQVRPHLRGAPLPGHATGATVGTLSTGGHILASSASDGRALLWDVSQPESPTPLPPVMYETKLDDNGRAASADSALSPDGHLLATSAGSENTGIQLWQIQSQHGAVPLGSPLPGHDVVPQTFAWTNDGKTLITGDVKGRVVLQDTTDPRDPHVLAYLNHPGGLRAVLVSANRRTLATLGIDGSAIVWDISDLRHPRQQHQIPSTGQAGSYRSSAALSADGRFLAMGQAAGTLTLWDLQDLNRPTRLTSRATQNIGPVSAVTFSADGTVLASANTDGAIQLWDLSDRNNPRQIGPTRYGNQILVVSLAFLPGERTLAVQTITEISLLDVSMIPGIRRNAVALACQRLGGQGLDHESWSLYAPGLDYRNTCPG